MTPQKPHIKPTNAQLRLNSAMRRLPFYTQGQFGTHMFGTKHSKAYSEYSWPLQLDFWFYHHVYKRVGLARAVVDLAVNLCWLNVPTIKNKDDSDNDQFNDFAERTGYFRACRDADRTQRVGHYGGMIVRVADDKRMNEPLTSTRMDNIESFMPFWEGQLIPGDIDQDQKSPRYGLPVNYTYNAKGVFKPNQRDGGDSFTVHHSRVRIRNEGAIGNTIYGESALEPVYNAVVDYEKMRGAGGEGAWRICAARPILKAAADTGGQAPTDEQMEMLIDAISDMHTSFDQVPFLGNMDMDTLNQDLPELKGYFDANLNDVAAGSGFSQAGLIGNQTGKMAGDKDASHDKEVAQSRRENYLTSTIKDDMKWLAEICTDFDNKGLVVEWTDLLAPSDEARLANAKTMSEVNMNNYRSGQPIVYSVDDMREITLHEKLEEDEFVEPEFTDGGEEVETNAKSYKPPESVQKAAQQGLDYRDKYGRGGTRVGIARGRDLSNGSNVSADTINRMVSFFARHEDNRDPGSKESDGGPTNGWIAWLLWGGDAGRDWANRIADEMEDGE